MSPLRAWLHWFCCWALLIILALVTFVIVASAQSKTADHLTSFCSVTWDVPPPTESMKRTFALEPKEWAALIDYLSRIVEKRKKECGDA